MKKKDKESMVNITIEEGQPLPIPIESLAILVRGESNNKFRFISKKITSNQVKLMMKHREEKLRVKVTVPIEFLEFHKIPYKNIVMPTNIQIAGVLDQKVNNWTVVKIVTDLSTQHHLVILNDIGSGKKIACKVAVQDIEKTKDYIEKCEHYSKANLDLSTISAWRETEWQREIQTRLSLLQSTHSRLLQKV